MEKLSFNMNEIENKINTLDADMQEYIQKLKKTNEKNENRLNKIMKQSDTQQLKLIELNEKMKTISETDKLTSIYNRSKCEETIKDLLSANTNFSMMLVDIDNFKILNAKFDIFIADKVLIQVSKNLKTFSNNSTFLGRWAGPTFMLIDTNTNLDEEIEVAEEICDKIASYFFDDVGRVTVSIGVSNILGSSDINSAIKTVANSLKKAKSTGENQVCV